MKFAEMEVVYLNNDVVTASGEGETYCTQDMIDNGWTLNLDPNA